jgi:hypothetical protein
VKWALMSLVLSGAAFAADLCESNCAETVKQCKDVCKSSLKKSAPDKINFCQDKCKEFENECKKECRQHEEKDGK